MRSTCWIGIGFGMFLLMCGSARADVVAEFVSVEEGAENKSVIKVKGEMMYVGLGELRMLTNTRTLEQTAVHDGQKVFAKGPSDVAEERRKTAAEARKKMPKLEKTGRTGRVGEYLCEEWHVQAGPKYKIVALTTKEYPEGEKIKLELAKQVDAYPAGLLYQPQVEGLVVRYMIEADGKVTSTTMLSAKVVELDEGEFKVPAGYVEEQ